MAKKQTGAAKAPVREAEVVAAENPDVQLVATDGSLISAFIGNVAIFFRAAGELEMKAKATLAKAQAIEAGLKARGRNYPETEDEDVTLQTFIKTTNAEKKAVEAHWSICQTFSQVHRRLTARRAVSTDALDAAAATVQRLHNGYVEMERRRVAEEQERIRQAAEQKAREDRELEAMRLENAAIEREAASADMSEREQHFVALVFAGTQPIHAARTAGFKNPEQQAARLMTLSKIIDAIKAKQDAEAIRQQAAATREKPLDVQVETVRPNIGKPGGGGFDRSTHAGVVTNERLFIEAVVGGQHGIPLDCLQVNEAKVNEYARSLRERLNLWPGVKYVKNTKTI